MNRLTIAAVLFASACVIEEPTPFLTKLTQISTSARCPAGGVLITTGRDWNRDDAIADEEVTETQEVCNGQTPSDGADGKNGVDGVAGKDGRDGADGANGVSAPVPLTNTVMLAVGDSNCPTGGARIDFGVDGVPGNGMLEVAEIQSTRFICNGTTPVYSRSTTPPAEPAAAYSIFAQGGDGGSPGGTVIVRMINGSLGGNVKVFKTGKVDASAPADASTFVSGGAPLRVVSDLTLRTYQTTELGLASGDSYFYSVPLKKVCYRQGFGCTAVSSIDVAADATLRLSTNATIILENDVRNAGTIRCGVLAAERCTLVFATSQYLGQVGSRMMGAEIGFLAQQLINRGVLDVHVAETADGGGVNGGRITVTSKYFENSGTLDLRGGYGFDVGGAGGRLVVQAGTFVHSGSILSDGVEGDAGGGRGGEVEIFSAAGSIRSSGTISARGGGTRGTGKGGIGGSVHFEAKGSRLASNTNIDVSGGDGPSGASAGLIWFEGSSYFNKLPAGSIQVSGNLIANGGSGTTAGTGGSITIELDPERLPSGQEVELFGYSSVNVNGGRGSNGSAGSISFLTSQTMNGETVVGPSGAVVNTVDLVLNGAEGGGAGGEVRMGLTLRDGVGSTSAEFVRNSGSIFANGGDGSINGNGGWVRIYATGPITNDAPIEMKGGSRLAGIAGGNGGTVELVSASKVTQTKSFDVRGGSGQREGGRGGAWHFTGSLVVNTGVLFGKGGDGVGEGGVGGRGGQCSMTSFAGITEVGSASMMGGGGTGGPRVDGYMMVDGVRIIGK